MKLIMENWKKFINESKTGTINTVRGKEEKEIAILRNKPVETEHWFVWKSGKYVYVTHKATGDKIDSHIWQPKYGKTLGAAKKLINDLEKNLDLPDIASSEGLSMESLRAILDFLKVDSINEASSKETADSFKKLASAFGDVSVSMSSDAQASEEMKEKFDELYSQFEKIGLDKIPDLGDLMKNVENGEGLAELTKSLQDAGIQPDEMGEKLEQIQILRDEFEEYKKEQEEAQIERDDKQSEVDQEQDRAMKDASRAQTDADNVARAQQAEM